MKSRLKIFLLLISLTPMQLSAQFLEALPRHAYWGASFGNPTTGNAGAPVIRVQDGTFAAGLDLRPGDRVLKVNDLLIDTPLKKEKIFYTSSIVKGQDQVNLLILRNGQIIEKQGIVPARPLEKFDGIITEYLSVLSPYGYRVQVIITRPEAITGKIPGIFFVRWMSCDPVEKPVSPKHGVARMLEDFIRKSGYAVIRVEKPGLGDSEGPPCYEADFQEELAAHQAAYKALYSLDYLDTASIMIFAHSNGAAYAPLVPHQSPAGYIISGGWSKTWYEHMLEYQRKQYILDEMTPSEINRQMTLFSTFYTEYLLHKKSPGEILKNHPHLGEIWNDEPDHQWGLPIAYLFQLQDLNVPAIWKDINVPVFIFYGEYDFAMSEEDHREIAGWINGNASGMAHFEKISKMDHSLFWFENITDARSDFYGKGVYKPELAEKIMTWMKKILTP